LILFRYGIGVSDYSSGYYYNNTKHTVYPWKVHLKFIATTI